MTAWCWSTPKAVVRRTGGLGEAKPGIGRIALEHGIPVVPVAIHGSASVRKWKKMVLPKVTIQFGEPMTFPVVPDATREQQLDCSNEVFDQVKTDVHRP